MARKFIDSTLGQPGEQADQQSIGLTTVRKVSKTASKRDYAKERHLALNRRVGRIVKVREGLEEGNREMMQVSQALILCGLPYEPTEKAKITRKARLGDGSTVSVTFSTSLESPMPFGSDRTLLHFLVDRAVKEGSPLVNWNTATEFLKAMNLAAGGKNRRDLRQRFQRLAGLTIGVQRRASNGVATAVMPVISRSYLPTSIDEASEAKGAMRISFPGHLEYGVELGQTFFADILAHHVPLPIELLRATRKQSQLQDTVAFLYWRCYAAESSSIIPWDSLRQQVWHDDTNIWRIRQRFDEAIRCLKTLWPDIVAETGSKGLIVAKPRRGKYITPAATEARRL